MLVISFEIKKNYQMTIRKVFQMNVFNISPMIESLNESFISSKKLDYELNFQLQ
jgi:hypothetical protein